MSPEQLQYEAYHSPSQKAARTRSAQQCTEAAIREAHHLFFSGDQFGAEQRLLSAGFQAEGIGFFLRTWGSDA